MMEDSRRVGSCLFGLLDKFLELLKADVAGVVYSIQNTIKLLPLMLISRPEDLNQKH